MKHTTRAGEHRPFCAHCGTRRYVSLMTEYPLPAHGMQTGKTFYCKGRWHTSECEQAAVKLLYARRKALQNELAIVTDAIKSKRQLELR